MASGSSTELLALAAMMAESASGCNELVQGADDPNMAALAQAAANYFVASAVFSLGAVIAEALETVVEVEEDFIDPRLDIDEETEH